MLRINRVNAVFENLVYLTMCLSALEIIIYILFKYNMTVTSQKPYYINRGKDIDFIKLFYTDFPSPTTYMKIIAKHQYIISYYVK
jgi:hypothetical protein